MTFLGLQQGSLRLAGSSNSRYYAGRLEIYINGQWGTVCDDLWGNNEANVACKQMGFGGAFDSDWTLRSSGSSSKPIWLDDVICTGSESQLINCNHRGLGVENCGHSEDIGIGCTRPVPSESLYKCGYVCVPNIMYVQVHGIQQLIVIKVKNLVGLPPLLQITEASFLGLKRTFAAYCFIFNFNLSFDFFYLCRTIFSSMFHLHERAISGSLSQ